MDLKLLFTVFGVTFLAELGDKTQLATLLFAVKTPERLLTVFAGASLALIATTAIGVAAGGLLAHYLSERVLGFAAGAAFVVIGIWTMWQSWGSV